MKKRKMIFCFLTGFILATTISTPITTADATMTQVKTIIPITAHRGASKKYPENSMLAFQKAKELGAEWIELDVRKTSDNKLIVIHDANLLKVANKNKYVENLTYEEIQKYDIGKGEKIPLLKQVVKFAKENNLRINIEIKVSDIEKDVINIINKYNYKDNVVISSMHYNVLKNVKNIDNFFTTVYTTRYFYEELLDDIYIDGFSIKYTSLNNEIVEKIHKNNKFVYVWTVNNEKDLMQIKDLRIDNIITDDVTLTTQLLD